MLSYSMVTVSLGFAGEPQGHDFVSDLINKRIEGIRIQTKKDKDGAERIAYARINITKSNRAEVLKNLSHLGDLKYLIRLGFNGAELIDEDLKGLPPLPNLQQFWIQTKGSFSDKGLKHLAGMKGLKVLGLKTSQVQGSGLVYLKDFNQLESLTLSGSQMDDSGMPHIVANFPKLERLSFTNTSVTSRGLMQLVGLHWLKIIGYPNSIIEKKQDLSSQQKAKRAIGLEFDKAHLASMRRARAAGIEVMPYDWAPFQSPELIDEAIRQRKKYFHAERIKIEALEKKEHPNTDKGWTSYPPKSLEDEAKVLQSVSKYETIITLQLVVRRILIEELSKSTPQQDEEEFFSRYEEAKKFIGR